MTAGKLAVLRTGAVLLLGIAIGGLGAWNRTVDAQDDCSGALEQCMTQLDTCRAKPPCPKPTSSPPAPCPKTGGTWMTQNNAANLELLLKEAGAQIGQEYKPSLTSTAGAPVLREQSYMQAIDNMATLLRKKKKWLDEAEGLQPVVAEQKERQESGDSPIRQPAPTP